jgi:translocator protein
MRQNYNTLVLLNMLGLTGALVVNYLSVALPLNGNTPGELSDRYPNLFVPAGLTFSIWGVIYTLLVIWVICQIVGSFNPKIKQITSSSVFSASTLFIGTCSYNALWLLAWHYQRLPLSLAVMGLLLFRLVRLNLEINNGLGAKNAFEKWVVYPAFGLYQGWITVATIANATTLLVAYQWSGWGVPAPIWASVMIAIGTLIAVWMVVSRRNYFHGVVVVWALLGIYLKRSGLNDAPLVTYAAIGGMVAVSISLLWTVISKRN